MDQGALWGNVSVTVLCLLALLVAWGAWGRSGTGPVRDWASAQLHGDDDTSMLRTFNIVGIVIAVLCIVIAELVHIQWTIVIIFSSLYALGYAFGNLLAIGTVLPYVRQLKKPPPGVGRTQTTNYLVLVPIIAFTALCVAITTFSINHLLSPQLAPLLFRFNVDSQTIEVNGYAIFGVAGIVLSAVLAVRMFLSRRQALHMLIDGIDEEGPDDTGVRADIIDRLNRGELVTREPFPTVDRDRLLRLFNGIAKDYSLPTEVDQRNCTMALRNAVAVRSLHEAFEAVRTARTDEQRQEASVSLVAALLRELGLPAPVAAPTNNSVFTVAMATPGSLAAVLPDRFPMLVTALDENSVREVGVIDALERALTQAATTRRFGIAIAAHSSQLLRTWVTQPDAGGLPQHVVYLDEDGIRAVLATSLPDIKAAFMAQVRGSVDLSIVAPFITKGPTTELMFVGRTKEMATILQDVETRSYAVLGGRRIGKTSMLQQIMLRLEQRGYSTLSMDCSTAVDYAAFANLMLLQWEDRIGDSTHAFPASAADDLPIGFQRLVAALTANNASGGAGKRLVFVFDEIDLLLFADLSRTPPEQLFRAFRVLSQTGKCQFIFSGERRIFEQFRDPKSPMYNFCMPIRPGVLNPDDAYKLVDDPFALLNIEIVDRQHVSEFIADACSYHPNLIQWVCAEIVKSLDRSAIQPRITAQLVHDIVSRPQFGREYLEAFWGQSTPLERAITVTISSDAAIKLDEVLQRLRRAGFHITEDTFRTALEYLELYCVLERTKDGVTLVARHLPQHLDTEIIDRDTYLRELSAQHS